MSNKNISHAISGGLSGLVSMTVTYPLVTMSTNAQAKLKDTNNELIINMEKSEEALDKLEPKPVDLKTKINMLLMKLVNRLKFFIQHAEKYYSGLESALIGIVAVNFAYYYIYNLVGDHFRRSNKLKKGLNVKQSLLTGLAAGIVSRLVTNPIWVANTRMTVKQLEIESNTLSTKSNKNTFEVMYDIFKKEGISGAFSGIGPALILVTSPMIQFTVFEQLKNLIVKVFKKKEILSVEALLLGSFGKLVAILATYPYYTVRSRMHLNMNSKDANSFSVLLDIIKKEGFSSLYGGINAKLLQSVLSAGLIFYFKEEMMPIVDFSVDKCMIKGQNLLLCIRSIVLKKLVSKVK